MTSAGSCEQSPIGPLRPKPASVRALTSLLWAEHQSIPFTFIVFELPDELIILILSHVSPDPRLTGPYTWFCTPHSRKIGDTRNQWVEFLRPLSMTCRTMRLRFLPWVWEHLVLPYQNPAEAIVKKHTIANVSHKNKFLATSVKYPYISPLSLG